MCAPASSSSAMRDHAQLDQQRMSTAAGGTPAGRCAARRRAHRRRGGHPWRRPREAITEAIELLGIDGKDRKPRSSSTPPPAARRLDRTAICAGAPARASNQAHSSARPAPSCANARSARRRSASSKQTQWLCVAQSIPTNHRTSLTLIGPPAQAGHRDPDRSLYWRSRRKPPTGSRSRPFRWGAVLRGAQAQVGMVAPGRSARTAVYKRRTNAEGKGGQSGACPPFRVTSRIDGGHGADAPLPTLRSPHFIPVQLA